MTIYAPLHFKYYFINQLGERIRESLTSKGRCLVAYIGSPGSGKSTIARLIRQHGFLTIPKEQLFVIDDLRGPENIKYRRKDLPTLIETLNNRVLLMFDFRAVIYLKRRDGIECHQFFFPLIKIIFMSVREKLSIF